MGSIATQRALGPSQHVVSKNVQPRVRIAANIWHAVLPIAESSCPWDGFASVRPLNHAENDSTTSMRISLRREVTLFHFLSTNATACQAFFQFVDVGNMQMSQPALRARHSMGMYPRIDVTDTTTGKRIPSNMQAESVKRRRGESSPSIQYVMLFSAMKFFLLIVKRVSSVLVILYCARVHRPPTL